MPAPTRATRFASILVTVMLALAVGVALFILVTGVVGAIHGGQDVSVHQRVSIDELESLPSGVVTQEIPITLKVDDAKPGQIFYSIGRDAIPVALLVVGLWLLRNIVRSVRAGHPFTAANVRRLRIIALLFLIGGPVAELVGSAFEQALATSAGLHGLGTGISFPGPAPIAGIGVLVLAEVFAYGVRLRDEAEGTI